MAYSTGTGANQQDLLDAVRTFAIGLGWTVVLWDTTNKRLYMEKGACHLALEWYNVNVNTYVGTTLTVVSEGRIRGTLCKTLTTAIDYSAFVGNIAVSGQTANAPLVVGGNLQGPYTGWFLFSNATGDYIHIVVQTSADMYTHIGFGNADKGGMTHAGAAYLFMDGGRYWFRQLATTTAPTSSSIEHNKPGKSASLFGDKINRIGNSACYCIYVEDALPSGFTNQLCMASHWTSVSYSRTAQQAHVLKTLNTNYYNTASLYPESTGLGGALLDGVITMSGAAYAPYVPMLGVPLIVTNAGYTLACAVGSIPDMRMINLTALGAGQELALSADTWKVFPQMRQADWTAYNGEVATSGQFGIAFKKIP